MNDAARTPSSPRLWPRVLVALAAFVGFELAARGLGVLDPTERPDPYQGFPGTSRLYRPEPAGDGVPMLRRSPNKPKYRDERFRAHKPPGAQRVFCLGGSSVVSSDYEDPDGSFPGMLRVGLRALEPDRLVEVVNAGGGGMASVQVLEVLREVLDDDPDWIVLYPDGGERNLVAPWPQGVMAARDDASPLRRDARRWLARSRLYGGLRDLWQACLPGPDGAAADVRSPFSAAVGYVASRPLRRDSFTRIFELKQDRRPPLLEALVPDDEVARAHDRFRRNLLAMIALCRARRVPLLLVEPVWNLRASLYLRFHVEPRELRPGREGDWRRLYDEGLAAKRAGAWERALERFAAVRACYREDHDEILSFYEGECLLALGRFQEARDAFARPYLERPIRLMIREIAAREDVPLVEVYPALCAASPRGIPGFGEFLDPFHPRARTNWRIAQEILRVAMREGLVPGGEGAPIESRLAVAERSMRARVAACPEPLKGRMLQAIQAGRYEDAVRAAREEEERLREAWGEGDSRARIGLVESFYLGWALTKLERKEELYRLYESLFGRAPAGGSVAAQGAGLDDDADVVRLAFGGDVFAYF